ncbi:MAG: M3 family metallopeptidase [Pseudomonadota bacterium]
MNNPLLEITARPLFSKIKNECIEPAIESILADNRHELNTILENTTVFTWENLIRPMEQMDNRLDNAWSPICYLNSVMDSSALRKIHDRCLTMITDYYIEQGHNKKLYDAIKGIKDNKSYAQFDIAQWKVIDDTLRDFKLSGITLSEENKKKLAELEQQQVTLSNQFAKNVLDATDAWYLRVDSAKELSGLPQQTLEIARQNAKKRGEKNFLLTLDMPCYQAVLAYCDNRDIRQAMYHAYTGRAANQTTYDNTNTMLKLLSIRQQIANLLGFATYAEQSLVPKTAQSSRQVLDFLHDIAVKAKPKAAQEFAELQRFAKARGVDFQLQAWDMAYYSEKYRHQLLGFDTESLRPYFQLTRVMATLFSITEKLFAIQLIEDKNSEIWHEQVKSFTLKNTDGSTRAYLYMDLYARPGKRDGAWMSECRQRFSDTHKIQLPVAFLTCNFAPPVDGQPSLLSFEEVLTLFHEFGHCLHHLLTDIDYYSVSGINGVAWDAVELPSQFFENFCYQPEILQTMARHYQSNDILPSALQDKLLKNKTFQAGLHLVRQLFFAMFDMRIHQQKTIPTAEAMQKRIDTLRDDLFPYTTPQNNRFQNSFSHIFAGGYAAGYYSYLWAEVLAEDAFDRFKQEGILNSKTGHDFLHCILALGGSQDAITLFTKFRGRPPKIDSLLKSYGI